MSGDVPKPAAKDEEKWKRKIAVFQNGYDEVLATTKHHDDKLNRILTALAFLTTAGIALFAQIGSEIRTTFDGGSARVTTVIFFVFIIAVVIALSSTLAAIGPSRFFSKPALPKESLIFYASIARNRDWDRFLTWSDDDLEERLATNLHNETKVIAKRVMYKLSRAREASAFAHVAIIALALQAIFSVGVASSTRWWVAAIFLSFMSALPLWDLGAKVVVREDEEDPSPGYYAVIFVGVFITALLLLLAPRCEGHWPALGHALGFILLSRLALVERRTQTWFLGIWAVVAVGAVVLFVLT